MLRVSRSPSPAWLLIPFLLFPLASHASPGDLVRYDKGPVDSIDDLQETRDDNGMDVELENGVRSYRVQYVTTTPEGEETTASGLVVIPDSSDRGPFPLISFQHGTTLRRTAAPSTDPTNEEAVAAKVLFGSRRFVLSIPDGLGLGKSPYPYHPFMHAASEATSAYDLILASSHLCDQLGIALTGELFLLGYSQGGHWTMALHQELDAKPIRGFRIVASAPMAGPFDLSHTTMKAALEHPTISSSVYSAYLFHAYMSVYGNIAGSYDEAIRAPYAARIPKLFSGATTLTYAYRKLPKRPSELFTESYLRAMTAEPSHPFLAALAQNDLYDWTPKEPIVLVHSRADEVVPFANATLTYQKMKEKGAVIELNEIPGEHGHIDGFLPAMQIAVKKFHPFLTPGSRTQDESQSASVF